MYWKLTPDVLLRSWQKVPFAYYERGEGNARKLTKEEFLTLAMCDGRHELEKTPLLRELSLRGLCMPVKEPSEVSAWQKARICGNRYFPAANWAITGKCNLNCRHCFMASDNARNMAEFTWEECLSLLDEMEKCGVQNITLTGGEPTIHPHFLDICREIAKRGMWLDELTTNGVRLTREVLEEFKKLKLFPLIKISFDGIGWHDWMRQKEGAEKEALEVIRLCLEEGFTVRVQTNVHRLNLNSILATAEKMDALGVEQMRIIRTTEAPRWVENAGDACLTMEEYYAVMLTFTGEFLKKPRQMEIDIWQFLEFWPESRRYHLRPAEMGCAPYRDSIPVCRGNRGRVAITPQGEVVPCNQMSGYYAKYRKSLGNVKKTPLSLLLKESDYLTTVTTTVGELFRENKTCGECKWRKICLGGCRAIALALTGDTLGTDPAKCAFFNKGYVEKCKACFPEGWECTDKLSPLVE